jgi:hypothetical protein
MILSSTTYLTGANYIKHIHHMAYSATILAWGGLNFPEGYKKAGLKDNFLDTLRWATDFILKAYRQEYFIFSQVNGGSVARWYLYEF